MSEVGEKPVEKPESTLIQQDGAIPETVIIPEEKPEEVAETEKVEEKPAEQVSEAEKPAEQPKREPWYQKRINELTRRAKTAEEKLAAIPPKEVEEAPAVDAASIEKLADQIADRKLAQRDYDRKSKAWFEAGAKEFGAADFNQKCSEVADMGAGESGAFMELITDPDIIPDGHKVVAALAANPEEATRILAMDPLRMSAALTKFATTAKPPEKKISNAPPPIKPIGGSAKPSEPNDNQSTKEWMANRNKTARTSAGGVRQH